MAAPASTALAYVLGRYALGEEIARGGLATVHLGLLLGESGFSRTIALKRLLPGFARDPEFVDAFLDEAKLAARIRHPNVVPTLDVLAQEGELFVVMEYVHGESLAGLIRAAAERGETIPLPVVSAIFADALAGLHAVHEVKDERGAPLNVIHRDVSPQNVLVGLDGVARVLDFGIAKAAGRAQITRDGQVKGKLGYLSPEQLRQNAGRGSDIYATGVCLWEALTMQRLFTGDNESAVLARIMAGIAPPPSKLVPELPPELDAVVVRALRRQPGQRFATARDMARALRAAHPSATYPKLGARRQHRVCSTLTGRADHIAALETEGASMRDQPAASGARPITKPAALDEAPPEPPTVAPVITDPAPPPAVEAPRRRTWLAWGGFGVTIAAAALVTRFALIPRLVAPPSAARAVAPLAGAPAKAAREVSVAAPANLAPSGVSVAPEAIPAAPTSPEGPVAAPPVAAPAAPKSSCDPPYSVDASGIRHDKKGCPR